MEAIQAAVEQACIEFQNPATQARAGQVLLHFRQHHRPALPACRYILEHSASPEARFQAVLVMKEALVREWAGLSDAEKEGLQAWLLHEMVRLAGQQTPPAAGSSAAAAPGSEQVQTVYLTSLVGTLAVAVKRGWLDKPPERRPVLLQELMGVVASGGQAVGGVRVAYMGLRALDSILAEFNVATATPLNLPWDYHQRSCRDMEEHYLQGIFTTACNLARQAAQSGATLSGDDGGVTGAALQVMTTCLQWEFKRGGMPVQTAMPVPHARQRGGDSGGAGSVTPGQPWSHMLLDPNTTQWVMSLLGQLKAKYGAISREAYRGRHMSAALAHLNPSQRSSVVDTALHGRALLGALCSLSGDVFPKQDGAGLRHQYLCVVLQGVLPMCWPVEAALSAADDIGYESSELADACRCLNALAVIHRAAPLQAAGSQVLAALSQQHQPSASTSPSSSLTAGAMAPGFLGLLQHLTLAVLRAGGVSASGVPTSDETDDRYWLQDCSDLLLEAWSSLLMTDPILSRSDALVLPEGTAAAAASVFQAVVAEALADAAAGALEELDDTEELIEQAGLEDWMARMAQLARLAPTLTLPHLADATSSAQEGLAAAVSQGIVPASTLEQLCWLVRMSAHCLADSGVGETPMVPLPLSMAIESGTPGAAEAVLKLCNTLLHLPARVLSPQARPIMSPRLMECCVWSLARWCDTYLFPEEDLPGPLQAAYGAPPGASAGAAGQGNGTAAGGGGLAVLDMAVQVANICLTSYPGEMELHRQVVTVLLPVLVRRKPLCERLMTLPAWQTLVNAAADRVEVLQRGLGQKLHRSLTQSLCLAANGISRTSVAAQYIGHLLDKTADAIVSLSTRQDLASAASRADVVVGVCCLLESLRGAMRATLSKTQAALWSQLTKLLQPLLNLQLALKAHTQAVALVLKLASDVVEAQISYLKPPEVDLLLRWVLALLQQYASINTWAVRLHASKTQQDASLTEAARDLRALLRLLGHVTQRDLSLGGDTAHHHHHGNGLDAATAANGHSLQASLDTAQVVLTGLNILLPLMTHDLLKFPKLPRLYFNLLAYMMENYPEQVCSLASEQFAMLMSSLDFGLSDVTTDPVVLQSALEGLTGLAKYQQHCQSSGLPGLSAHSAGGRTAPSHFLETLLKRLLLGDWPQDIVEMAADALHPLLVVERNTYAQLAQQLVAAHLHDAAAGQRIAQALASLLQTDQLTAMPPGAPAVAVIRHSRRMFRQALCDVVTDVRSLICVR